MVHPQPNDEMSRPYYVGLLSAAQLHGAAHQRPQKFQVVIPSKAVRPIGIGNISICFHIKSVFDRSQTQEIKTPTGILKVSTPETTAWDIVRYYRAAGGFENAVTVLTELAEKLNNIKLRDTVKRHEEVIAAQRLGYILDKIRRQNLSKGLAGLIGDAPLRPLDPSAPIAGASVSRKWRILINAPVEPEI